MASSADINRLRAEARARQKAATGKVSRLRRNLGIEVAGTEFDPRSRDIAKMNGTQLRAHIRKLNKFTARDNRFIAGSEGSPIPLAEWKGLQRDQELTNRHMKKKFGEVADIVLPGGLTVKQNDATIKSPDKVVAKGEAVMRPVSETSYQPSNIADVAGLRALRAQLKRKRSTEYLPEELERQRGEADRILERIGNDDFTRRIRGLSDHAFNALWNYNADFMRDFSHYYFIVKASMEASEETKQKWNESVENDYLSGIARGINWAENVKQASQKKPRPS